MVKRRIVQLVCDGCSTLRMGKPSGTVTDLREQLVKIGWSCIGDRDVCPGCLASGVKAW